MERELKTIALPSGKKAKIVTYFTRGEVKAIEAKKWEGAVVEQSEIGTVQIKNISPLQMAVQDDNVVLQGTKFIVAKDVETPVTDAVVKDLDIKDFRFILKELNALYLEIEDKKKISKS